MLSTRATRSRLEQLERISTEATAALKQHGDDTAWVQVRINDAVAAGRLGAQYKQRTEAWFPGALTDLLDRMRNDVPQTYIDWEAYEDAIESREEAEEKLEKPEPKDFERQKLLEFGFGDLGSVWFDVDLTGTVDGQLVTKRTRVALASDARPYQIIFDATFDETF